MTSQYIYDHIPSTVNIADNEQIFVAATGAATGSWFSTVIGIATTGSNNTITVLGTVSSGTAISMGNEDTDHDNRLFIGETGHLYGANGFNTIGMQGNNAFIENEGTIWNKDAGGSGIFMYSANLNGMNKIVNSGTIDVGDLGVVNFSSEKLHIENSGLIKAGKAIVSFSGAMEVVNTGKITGTVQLSAGNDILDTRTGELIGIVATDVGNDIFYGSKGNDRVSGGADNDKLYGYNGNDNLDGGDGNDTVMGGNGNDVLFGGTGVDILYGEAGKDTIDGHIGKDKIYGGSGKDQLTGGADADDFIFAKGDTGKTKATADTILDFEKVDHINLSLIDANTKLVKDQAFTFIGTQAFHGKAGELRFEKSANDTYISGDTNGDKKADFIIHLDDPMTMAKGYFVL